MAQPVVTPVCCRVPIRKNFGLKLVLLQPLLWDMLLFPSSEQSAWIFCFFYLKSIGHCHDKWHPVDLSSVAGPALTLALSVVLLGVVMGAPADLEGTQPLGSAWPSCLSQAGCAQLVPDPSKQGTGSQPWQQKPHNCAYTHTHTFHPTPSLPRAQKSLVMPLHPTPKLPVPPNWCLSKV